MTTTLPPIWNTLIERLNGQQVRNPNNENEIGWNDALDTAIAIIRESTRQPAQAAPDVELVAVRSHLERAKEHIDTAIYAMGDSSAAIAPAHVETSQQATPDSDSTGTNRAQPELTGEEGGGAPQSFQGSLNSREITVVNDFTLIGMLRAARPDVPPNVVTDFVKGKAKNLDYLTCDMAEFRRIAAYLTTKPVSVKQLAMHPVLERVPEGTIESVLCAAGVKYVD